MKININRKIRLILMGVAILLAIFLMTNNTQAHPGRTAGDGCHYCRTNCDYWGVPWNQRHCHNGGVATTPKTPTPTPTPKPVEPVCHEERTTEEVPYNSRHIQDANIEKEKSVITTPGKKGIKENAYKICILNGKEVSRELISANITTKPIDEIISDGTKEITPQVAGATASNSFDTWFFVIVLVVGLSIFIWFLIKGLISKKESRNKN